MTVTYSLNVAEARLAGFAKLLIRWRGSIYQLLYREMIIFVIVYYALGVLYRYVLTQSQRLIFERTVTYCESFTNYIPLSFVLGFYVSIVVGRWWNQYMSIPWPDKCIFLIAGYVHGSDERGRIIRRTLARWLLLMMTLTCQSVSTSVRKRFPTLDHLEEAGIMTKEERIAYDDIPCRHGKWWVPTGWFMSLIVRCRKEGRIKDEQLLKQITDELHEYRSLCGMLFAYDWISVPLVYTQVVTIAVYMYFIANLMARQYVEDSEGRTKHDVDLYFPIFTILEFFFYMGWLKVAEVLINPFGCDDDDFELNWCLDRNMVVSYWVVDNMYNRHPRLVKDFYFDDADPTLPYTRSSVKLRSVPHLGSAMNLEVENNEQFIPMETIMEEEKDENNYISPGVTPLPESVMSPDFAKAMNGDAKQLLNNMENGLLPKEARGSTTGLHLPHNFPGAQYLNMILGGSRENVHRSGMDTPLRSHPVTRPDTGMSGGDQGSIVLNNSTRAPFRLKTPNRQKRSPVVGGGGGSEDTASLRGARGLLMNSDLDDIPATAPIHPIGRGTPFSQRRADHPANGADQRPGGPIFTERGFVFPKPPVHKTGSNLSNAQNLNEHLPGDKKPEEESESLATVSISRTSPTPERKSLVSRGVSHETVGTSAAAGDHDSQVPKEPSPLRKSSIGSEKSTRTVKPLRRTGSAATRGSRTRSTSSSFRQRLESEAGSSDDGDDRVSNAASLTRDDIYEPTSSQESLEQYVDSNQSTVTSLAQIMSLEQPKRGRRPNPSSLP